MKTRIALLAIALAAGLGLVWVLDTGRFQRSSPPGAAIAKDTPEHLEEKPLCPEEQGSKTFPYGTLTLRVERDAGNMCGFDVRAGRGPVIASADGAVEIDVEYADLDGDGRPELVIRAE